MFQLTKGLLVKYITALTGKDVKDTCDFSERIKNRHRIFWQERNADNVRNTIMDVSDPTEKWEDVKHWQRKLSNKYNSREFAKKHNCRVAGLYWKGRDYNLIDFDNLPQNYVIRPTNGHSLKMVHLMKDGINLMNEKKCSKEDIKEVMAKASKKNKKLEFLIEEFVRTETGEYRIPDDFKFYMFNGQVGCIQVISRNNNTEGYTSWYDENWNLLSNLTTNYPDGKERPVPECLPEMIECARKLSKSYKIFIRIDFYATDKGSVFGEFTPTPGLGKGFTSEGKRLLTDYWDKFCYGMI